MPRERFVTNAMVGLAAHPATPMATTDEISFRLPKEAARQALEWIHAHLEDMGTINDPDADRAGSGRNEYLAVAPEFDVMATAYRERFSDLNIRSFWPENPDEL
jgi:hypothetical protein